MNKEDIIDGIKEAAKRSAWIRVLSAEHAEEDSIVKDAALLRLNWSSDDAKIMEDYFAKRGNVTQQESQAAMDRGVMSLNDFIDIFFTEKKKALDEIGEKCE